ncbi:MAG: flagellar biosynthetic protein FliR [Pseudomonadota bacterium]
MSGVALSVDGLVDWASQVLWATLRVAGFIMVVPIFGNPLVTARVKVALSLAIGIAVGPLLTELPAVTDFTLTTVLLVAEQLLTGIGLGFATSIFFQLFVVAGQFMGMQMGLGFAMMTDPVNGVQVTAWSQFFLLLVSLTFLAVNGHLLLIEILIEGFKVYPTGLGIPLDELAERLAALGGWMFAGGVLIALPAVTALLIVNLAFGVMTRSAPQLNIFSLGFPFSIVFGAVVMWVALQGWLPQFDRMFSGFLEQVVPWTR